VPSTPARPHEPALTQMRAMDRTDSAEFSMFAVGRTSPVATWLRSLARELHAQLGGPGVGAVGMCLTGGFALAMLADAPIAARC
jgi:dienelactone hydrolase